MKWQSITTAPENQIVNTKIDTIQDGARNEQLMIRKGNLWFFPNQSMYVYYRPTHWHSITKEEANSILENSINKLKSEIQFLENQKIK